MGVTHIINLGLGYGKDALQDEAGKVEALGMKYIHIPVDFEKPTAENFEHFKTALEENAASQIHVHCIYNARVSAFFFRLSKSGTALTEASAFAIMDSIWKPGDDWAIFIGDENAKGRPNRYAGEDY